MFFPWAEAKGALIGGFTSIVFMLWVSIGGNFSRLSGQVVYEQKSVSIDGCPDSLLNKTSHAANTNAIKDALQW